MNLLRATNTTAQHFIQAFSWTLLHSLWQGLLLAIFTALVLTLARRSAASVRYNLVLTQFILFILACGGTFAWEWLKTPGHAAANVATGETDIASLPFNLSIESIRLFAQTCIRYFTANAPVVVLLWFVFFVFRSVRMMGSLVYLNRARNRHVYQPSAEWKARVEILCEKLQLKRGVTLLESGFAKTPMVIGHLKPVILVPIGLLAGLPAGQVEAVLLHELAHIRRHDYVVNFLQTVTETIFFFNPGLLWISSLLRDERENCCDDIALAQTKNKKEFIQALISFKEHSLYGASCQVAFPGKKNHLLNRVSRILNNKNKAFGPGEKVFFMSGVIILSAIVATAAIAQVQVAHYHIDNKVVVPARPEAIETVRKVFEEPKSPARKPSSLNTLPQPLHESVATFQSPAVEVAPPEMGEQHAESISDQQQAKIDQIQAIKDQEQAKRDQVQALHDQAQAKIDQEQARRDQKEARIDQEGAKKDQKQASRDKQQQAEVDKAQAKQHAEQAARNAEQAKRNREQDARNQEQVVLNNIQSKKNAEQAERNKMQAKLNELQAKRNVEQNIRNKEQVKRNLEQDQKNNTSVQ